MKKCLLKQVLRLNLSFQSQGFKKGHKSRREEESSVQFTKETTPATPFVRLNAAAAPGELLPTPGCLDVAAIQCRAAQCVGSGGEKGQFLRVETRHAVAAASSRLQARVQSFQAANAGCLRPCEPDQLLRLALCLDKTVNRL